MKIFYFTVIALSIVLSVSAQEQIYPVFEECLELDNKNQKDCFESTLLNKLRKELNQNTTDFKSKPTEVSLIFEVDKEGNFNLI
jgi:cell division protein FtsL